jgi:hypothetical protein
MSEEIAALSAVALQILIVFALVYWAARLAIRHERARERGLDAIREDEQRGH